ncbi:MAG: GNAT family N-acetyltransferase [Ginsengibacter sp.]
MIFRQARIEDIQEIQLVRNSVKENALSEPGLVTDADCENYIIVRGKGWVCEINNTIVGFAIADLAGKNIWALFVRPEFEKKGIGKKLHDTMLGWYFSKTMEKIWLCTAPGTRAGIFYRKCGWTEVGKHGKGEIKFEMTYERWIAR